MRWYLAMEVRGVLQMEIAYRLVARWAFRAVVVRERSQRPMRLLYLSFMGCRFIGASILRRGVT